MMLGPVAFAFRYNCNPHQQDVPESEQQPRENS
jgi:hypothetical protein